MTVFMVTVVWRRRRRTIASEAATTNKAATMSASSSFAVASPVSAASTATSRSVATIPATRPRCVGRTWDARNVSRSVAVMSRAVRARPQRTSLVRAVESSVATIRRKTSP